MTEEINTSENLAQPSLEIPVGYSDPLIGLGNWPLTTSGYLVLPKGADGAKVSVTISMQCGALLPDASETATAAKARSEEILKRFSEIYYQIWQPDVSAHLTCTLDQAPGEDPIKNPVSIDELGAYVSAATSFCLSCGTLNTVSLAPNVTKLKNVINHYGLTWRNLALANLDRKIEDLLEGGRINLPTFQTFFAQASISTLLDGIPDPPRPPSETVEQALPTPLEILSFEANQVLPLRPGTQMHIEGRDVIVDGNNATLQDIAIAENIEPGSLVEANVDAIGILRPGFVFEADGEFVEVDDNSTFATVSESFEEMGVPFTPVMVAVENEDAAGMFIDGAILSVDRYKIQTGDTLQSNGSGEQLTVLLQKNISTPDLFPAGTPILVSITDDLDASDQTLKSVADTSGIEPQEILFHSQQLPLATNTTLELPGIVSLAGNGSYGRFPFTIGQDQSLKQILNLVKSPSGAGNSVEALASANALMPATIVGGQGVISNTRVGWFPYRSVETQAGDSFQSLATRAQMTVSQLANLIQDRTDILNKGALLLTGAASPKVINSQPTTPKAVAEKLGFDVTSFFAANAATAGLIHAAKELVPDVGIDTPTVTTVQEDSFNAIAARFGELGIQTTPAQIAAANSETAFLKPGAQAILPPKPREIQVPLWTSGKSLPGAIFPIKTSLTICRNRKLVEPAFRSQDDRPSDVESVSTMLAAAKTEDATGSAGSLKTFKESLQSVLPELRLATGKPVDSASKVDPTDLWSVSFEASNGIPSLHIEGTQVDTLDDAKGPEVLALRPLSNTLSSRHNVPIHELSSDGTLTVSADHRTYQNIDLDTWARRFLSDVDMFLGPNYAGPCYRVASAQLARVLEAKASLAISVAEAVAPVLVGAEVSESALAAAKDEVVNELLGSLSRANEVDAILQYQANIGTDGLGEDVRFCGMSQLFAPTQASPVFIQGLDLGLVNDPVVEPDEIEPERTEEQRLQASQVQLSNAKIPLKDSEAPVTFLMFVPRDAAQSSVSFDFKFLINEVEYNIENYSEGYAGSDWLTLLETLNIDPPANVSIDMGKPHVPLPLRSYPSGVALIDQTAVTATKPDSISEAVHWDYVVQYQHDGAAQDQVWLKVSFNQEPQQSQAIVGPADLFTALAQYNAVADSLWDMLAELTQPESSPASTQVVNAVATFGDLVKATAAMWQDYWANRGPDPLFSNQPATNPTSPLDPINWNFVGELKSRLTVDGTAEIAFLNLKKLTKPGNSPVLFERWPEISIIDENGTETDLVHSPTDALDQVVYAFPVPISPLEPLRYVFSFKHLHIAEYQNVTSDLSVVRNARLLGAHGPATTPDFIYHTPVLKFPETLVPKVSSTNPINIGPWSGDPLNSLFEELFAGDAENREIALASRFGFAMGGETDPLETFIPATLFPRQEFTGSQAIANALDTWMGAENPKSNRAIWRIALSFFSAFPAELARPIVELKALVSDIDT